MEGIFRLAGSEKRIKELKLAFDSPDRYGKGLDWTGYTVHDAANILRRYFNQLPEPIIPLDFYDRFRRPITGHQAEAVGNKESQTPGVGGFSRVEAIRGYQALITEIPPLNRQLLLYILDLLAVFASKSDFNKMTTANLSAIFQPGLLSHPQHDMAPEEYRLSQDVLIFLIENQDHFLIGMQGTAADPETVRAVQSGATSSKSPSTPTTPTRSRTVVGRTSSNASAGAESVRKWGGPRRNLSVSSKHSRQSEIGPAAVAAAPTSPSTPTSGVQRSNTVPSRRGGSGAGRSPRYSKDKISDPPTPTAGVASAAVEAIAPRQQPTDRDPVEKHTPAFALAPPEVTSASSSEITTPPAGIVSDDSSANTQMQTTRKDTTPLLASLSTEQETERAGPNTPSAGSGHGFLGFLKQSPSSDGEGRKPNKLQKKRIPGSSLSSAQSSTHDLPHDDPREVLQVSSIAAALGAPASEDMSSERGGEESINTITRHTPTVPATPQRHTTDATLRPTISPTHSYQSQTDQSDADLVGDDMPAQTGEEPDREKKKHRWRLSRPQNKLQTPVASSSVSNSIGTTQGAREQTSRSTFGSSQPRRSFQDPVALIPAATDSMAGQHMPVQPAQPLHTSTTDPVFSDSEKERKGPMSWIRGKLQDRKDKDAEKRSKTPDRNRERGDSRTDLQVPPGRNESSPPVRGKSMEQTRKDSNTTTTIVAVPPPAPLSNVSQGLVSPVIAPQLPTSGGPASQPPSSAAVTASMGTSANGNERPGTALTAAEFLHEAERRKQMAETAGK